MKYRHKQQVDAKQWTGDNWDEVRDFAKDCPSFLVQPMHGEPWNLVITSIEGLKKVVRKNDWIVKSRGMVAEEPEISLSVRCLPGSSAWRRT
jgi:hypothetical protein